MLTCSNCRCPQVGNETFCSNCGTRVFGAGGSVRLWRIPGKRAWKLVAAIAAALLLLGAFGAAGIHFVRQRARADRKRAAEAMPSVFSPVRRFEGSVRRFSRL